MKNEFKEKVLWVVTKIPKGKTMSYMQVAEAAGFRNAYRAVGSIMSQNTDPSVPCHRVICSNGMLGEYNGGGTKRKKDLLISEGVSIEKRPKGFVVVHI